MSYLDAAILGRSSTAPGLFSVGLMDGVCPPSTVFAAFHNYGDDDEGNPGMPFTIRPRRRRAHSGPRALRLVGAHLQASRDLRLDGFARGALVAR